MFSMKSVPTNISSLVLPQDGGIYRMPTRDPALRHGDFWKRYDSHTLFFDLFRTADPTLLIAVAPPFHNLIADLDLRLRAQPSGRICSFRREMRVNVDRLHIVVPAGTEALLVETRLGTFRVVPSPDLTPVFRSRRTLLTLSQDNDLVWVRDWAQFYVGEHGVDAVVVYDNGSTRYGSVELRHVLESVPGLAAVAVVDWPFAYGPADYRRDLTLDMGDCDYCQRGMFEHARTRLLGEAAAVVNADVDELIYRCGDMPLFESLDQSDTGFLSLSGVWVEAIHDGRSRDNRHAAYYRRLKADKPEAAESKWVVDPRRQHRDAQWDIHYVNGAAAAIESVDFLFGHFRSINTNWDLHTNLSKMDLRTDGPGNVALEDIDCLRTALERNFPDRNVGMVVTPPQRDAPGAYVAKILASSREVGAGEETGTESGRFLLQMAWRSIRIAPQAPDEAIALLKRATALEPSSPLILNMLIRLLHVHGRVDEALSIFEDTPVATDKKSRGQFFALEALVRHKAGDATGARKAIDAALALRGQKIGYRMLDAQLHEASGNIGAAEESLNKALEIARSDDTLSAENRELANDIYFSGFRFKDHPIALETTAPAQPWQNIIQFLLRNQRAHEAVGLAHEMVRRSQLNAGSHFLLGSVLDATGDKVGKAEVAQRVLKLAEQLKHIGVPSHRTPAEKAQIEMHRNMNLMKARLLNKDMTGVMELAQTHLDDNYGHLGPIISAATQLLRDGAPSQALHLSEAVLERNPSHRRALMIRLEALEALEQTDRLKAEVIRLDEIGIDDAAVWVKLGQLLRKRKEITTACIAFQHAIVASPSTPNVRFMLFWALFGQGRTAEASEVLSDLLEKFSSLPMTHYAHSKLLNRQGRTAEALRAVERALCLGDMPDAEKFRDELRSR